ncbi:unnamed protein product [Brassica rapa]|uniref:Uncharacterized protein n=2 Tax=Brassica TaxID=3705 RepID=A0A3P6BIJ6_BRACM|nr:unnamed protein product [Brassica napus]CAG7904665.1 unnamed protein product [Brassica rapa]CDY45428.1 BnaA07g32080D [Brassica napus]VDD02156.1 unnamed protein product [Brassica rapa]
MLHTHYYPRILTNCLIVEFYFKIVGLYPGGSPSRNSRRPKTSLGPGGGLEIVFNQQ